MPTTAEIASNIVASLALTEPTLDTSVGSVTRKIIDAVSGVLSEQSSDNHLITYTYDIDSKTGADLDDFCALFGIKRFTGNRATGICTFSRPADTASTTVASVPMGTQVSSATATPVSFQTVMSATLGLGQLAVDIPVQAFSSGPSGNVAAGTLVNLASSLDGIGTVNNAQPCVGGTNDETDDQLRTRFKATVFQSLAGTQQMYRGMALKTQADPTDPTSLAVTAANVIGPRMTYNEQVAIQADGTAMSSIPDAAFIYSASVYLGADIAGGLVEPQGANQSYTVTINNAVFPATLKVTAVSGGPLVVGTVWDLQFDYVSKFSRNDPFGTRWAGGSYISTRVDLWVNGLITRQFTQSCVYSTDASLTFVTDTPHQGPMDPTRFSLLNGSQPVAGDFFTPLLAGPILWVPTTLQDAAAKTYTLGTHYDIVHQSDAFGYSPTSKFGLVWHHAASALPANGTKFTLTYNYNRVPTQIQNDIESQWRLLGTDMQVHGGIAKYYRYHLAVVYNPGTSTPTVNLDINTALFNLVNSLGFRSALQVSDILQAVHNVAGVDNVRFLTSTDDPTNYGIQQLYRDPLYPSTGHTTPAITGPISAVGGRAADVYFDDASYPQFDPTLSPVRIVVKARNTFGVS